MWEISPGCPDAEEVFDVEALPSLLMPGQNSWAPGFSFSSWESDASHPGPTRPLAARKVLHHDFLQHYTAASRQIGGVRERPLIGSRAEALLLLPKPDVGICDDLRIVARSASVLKNQDCLVRNRDTVS